MIVGAIAWERDQPGELTIVAITALDSSSAHPTNRPKHLSALFRRAVTANNHELAHEMAGALAAVLRAPYAILDNIGVEVTAATTIREFWAILEGRHADGPRCQAT